MQVHASRRCLWLPQLSGRRDAQPEACSLNRLRGACALLRWRAADFGFSLIPSCLSAAYTPHPPSLSRSTFTRTHLPLIRQGFDTFLGKVAVGMAEKSKAEMEASLAQA